MGRGSASSKKVNDLTKRRFFHARDYWAPRNLKYPTLLGYALDLNHYKRNEGLSKDASRQQPKTQRQFNLLRHKASLLLANLPQFDSHATQPGVDAIKAEVSQRIIEQVFHDPLKGYHDYRSRMVWSMLAAERGCIAIDWHQKWGACFRFVDPRRLHLTPGFTFLHDVRNPVTYEEVPMRRSEAIALGWNIPDDLVGDGGMPLENGGGNHEADGIERDQGADLPGTDEDESSDPLITFAKAWYRSDPYSKRTRKVRDADLPVEQWLWVDDQTQLTQPFDPMQPTPPPGPSGQPMRLVTRKDERLHDEYDDGTLIITAPYSHMEVPVFEGGWLEGALNPDVRLEQFPYMELTSYKHPLRRSGRSDTELTHTLTFIDNATTRQAYEQTMQAGAILVQLANSLKDADGNSFKFTSDSINIAHAEDVMGLDAVKFFQAPGMNPTMPAMWQRIEQQWQHIGTGDFSGGLGPERSKDIAVGTANLLQQTGDLPVQLHAQDLSAQEAIGAYVVLTLCRAYMGDNVVSWVTDDGDAAYATVRGSDLEPINLTVRADKQWKQQDTDKMQAVAQFLGMVSKAGLPPQVIVTMLIESGLSAKVARALGDAMQPPQQPPAANGAPPPGGPPALEVVQGGRPQ